MTRRIRPFTLFSAVLALILASGRLMASSADLAQRAVAVQERLDGALRELASTRRQAADRIVPMNKEINELEQGLLEARNQLQESQRTLDERNLKLNNLRAHIKARKQEKRYLSNLLGEYVRNLETQLHISQADQYRECIKAAKFAQEDESLSARDAFASQMAVVEASLKRLEDLVGGYAFVGEAVTDNGTVSKGQFVLIGPLAFFCSDDLETVGMAVERLGSTEPNVISVAGSGSGVTRVGSVPSADSPRACKELIQQSVRTAGGWIPLDATLGKAQKMAETKETLGEHLSKGGIVVYPILTLAGIAMLTALLKWFQLARTPVPSDHVLRPVLADLGRLNQAEARQRVAEFSGPIGQMLQTAVHHLNQSRELVEELMYEQILETRMRLQKGLPFLAVCASSAPLLGLLGTVTGIISTFKLITAFGSGDVKMLSAGISEALVTTELGLIVAIPSLLLHALLNRRAKSVVDRMEKTAVAVLNQMGGADSSDSAAAVPPIDSSGEPPKESTVSSPAMSGTAEAYG